MKRRKKTLCTASPHIYSCIEDGHTTRSRECHACTLHRDSNRIPVPDKNSDRLFVHLTIPIETRKRVAKQRR